MIKEAKITVEKKTNSFKSNNSGVFRVNIGDRIGLATTNDEKPTHNSLFFVKFISDAANVVIEKFKGDKLYFYHLL